jgi:hypothetical protein
MDRWMPSLRAPEQHHISEDPVAFRSDGTAERRLPGGCRDKALLAGTALSLCVIVGGAFLLGEIYHINPGWIFLAWNSIFLLAVVGGDFRGQFRRPRFVAFFALWMVVHGIVMVILTGWVPILYWAPAIFVDLMAGYFAANILFGVMPKRNPSGDRTAISNGGKPGDRNV